MSISQPYSFTRRSCQRLAQPPSWRTTPCRLSANAYSIYSQLPSISEAVPPSATWGRAMQWWLGPRNTEEICTVCTCLLYQIAYISHQWVWTGRHSIPCSSWLLFLSLWLVRQLCPGHGRWNVNLSSYLCTVPQSRTHWICKVIATPALLGRSDASRCLISISWFIHTRPFTPPWGGYPDFADNFNCISLKLTSPLSNENLRLMLCTWFYSCKSFSCPKVDRLR